MTSGFREDDGNSILENFSSDSTRSELVEFIATLNDNEQASLVAVAWVGRGSFSAEEIDDAIETAKIGDVNKTERYLLGIPLLADYLKEGLDKLGFSIEDAEAGIL